MRKQLIGRIKYYENYMNMEQEGYAFELYEGGEEWGLDTFYPLDENDKMAYQALTKVREWQVFNVKFHFE